MRFSLLTHRFGRAPVARATLLSVLAWCEASWAEPPANRGTAALPSPGPDAVEDSWLVPSVHGLGLMTGMRVGAAILWPEPFADTNTRHIGASYRDAFTHTPRWDSSRPAFEWDGDWWVINVVGHGLFGSELYARSRICRRNVFEALTLTTVGSALWEYGFEASAVRPSGLDLWFTPLAGMVLGEARYQGWRAASQISDPNWRGVFTVVFDPLGEFERALGTGC
jgi:hypothetical protein